MPVDKSHILSIALCDRLIEVVTQARSELNKLCSDVQKKENSDQVMKSQANINILTMALGCADDEISKILDKISSSLPTNTRKKD